MEPTEEDKHAYYTQLTEQEKMILHIAKRQLGTSFDLVRSNGFVGWFHKQTTLSKPKV